jgi:SAM-dependent methyltransferase
MQNEVELSSVDRGMVMAAYRMFLGRDPEDEEVIRYWLSQCETLRELRHSFLYSDEFATKEQQLFIDRRFPCDLSNECPIDVTGTPEQLSALFGRVSKTWKVLGHEDPYWSVLSVEKFRQAEFEAHRCEFFESGNADVKRMIIWMERNGLALQPGQTSLEYGCGTARVTPYLARHFEMTHACDISQPHLSLAGKVIRQSGLEARVAFHLIESPESLAFLPPADVVFSVIVLQHNPPPVIAYVLDKLLTLLRKGGIAYFQVPTFRKMYSFDLEEYLKAPAPEEPKAYEMHVLPQRHVFDIISRNGCQVLEVQGDNMTGHPDFVSNTFLVRKT